MVRSWFCFGWKTWSWPRKRPLTDSESASAVRDSAIGCTQNLLLSSLWTNQSSLTYVFKAALLAACSSCHGNPNAISPHCLDRSISWKLFQSPGILKLEGPIEAVVSCRFGVRCEQRYGCVCVSRSSSVTGCDKGRRLSLDLHSSCRRGCSVCCSLWTQLSYRERIIKTKQMKLCLDKGVCISAELTSWDWWFLKNIYHTFAETIRCRMI